MLTPRTQAERLAKEAAEKEEAERKAKEAAEKAEADRRAKGAVEKAEAPAVMSYNAYSLTHDFHKPCEHLSHHSCHILHENIARVCRLSPVRLCLFS